MTPEIEALCARLEAAYVKELDRGRVSTSSDLCREAATKLREMAGALDGFVDALTSGGNNAPTMLSINHDVLRACLDEALATLAGGSHG